MRRFIWSAGLASFFFFTVTSAIGWAEPTNAELMAKIESLQKLVENQNKKITTLENRVSEIKPPSVQVNGATPQLGRSLDEQQLIESEDYSTLGGLRIAAGATYILQQDFNVNKASNTSRKHQESTDASYSIDLEFEKKFQDWGKAYMHLETGDGTAGNSRLASFSDVNYDSYDKDHVVNLTEVWYEHYLFEKQVTVKAGVLDPTIELDQNVYANDETINFLGSMFRNNPVIDFSRNHMGGIVTLAPDIAKWFELSGMYTDGGNDGDKIASTGFMATQINLKPIFLPETRPGNYRVYGWRNNTNHTKWLDSQRVGEAGFGFGLSADQKIMDHLGVFGRYGWQSPDVYLLDNAWSAGLQLDGDLWRRPNDFIGLGFGQVFPGKNWRIQGDSLSPSIIRNAAVEQHLELYYNFRVNKHLTLTPDLQWIWNPYGMDTDPSSATDLTSPATIVANHSRSSLIVLGMRGQLDF